jgi:hypothetical protein
MRTLTRAVLALLFVLLVAAQHSVASFIERHYHFNPAAVATDKTIPSTPRAAVYSIHRGTGPTRVGEGELISTSLDQYGAVRLIVRCHDDRSPVDSLGFRVFFVGGALPTGCSLPTRVLLPSAVIPRDSTGLAACLIGFSWDDGAVDAQGPFAFDVVVTTVDKGGNDSDPSEPVRVADAGK